MRKVYTSDVYPSVTIGGARFVNGFYETDNEDEQRLIEESPFFLSGAIKVAAIDLEHIKTELNVMTKEQMVQLAGWLGIDTSSFVRRSQIHLAILRHLGLEQQPRKRTRNE